MKFQKGLLRDLAGEPMPAEPKPAIKTPDPLPASDTSPAASISDKDHLFETVREETGSEQNYLKLLSLVVLGVLIAGSAVFYLTLPGIGDAVRAPAGLELAVRDHFLLKEKRTATDIIFYQCDGYYGAKVGVETRSDIPNPLFRIDTYSARAVERGGQWEISAAPVTPPNQFSVCK
jgi:hypothetical protein